jgi:phosphomannomutase
MDVVSVGRLPTPALAFATHTYHLPGVMVTASHNPPTDNGLKCFERGFEIGRDDECRIEDLFHTSSGPQVHPHGTVTYRDVMPSYTHSLHAYVKRLFPDEDLHGMTILLDGGNGMGTGVLQKVLIERGATVHSVNSHVSELFPGRASEPSPEHLSQLLRFAPHVAPDLIIAQDGDADRIAAYAADGKAIPEDSLIALFADFYSSHGETIVLSIDTSLRTDLVVRGKDVTVRRVPLGYLHDGITTYEPLFAAEPWKHVHVPFGPWIDGIVSALLLSHFIKAMPYDSLFSSIPSFSFEKRNVNMTSQGQVDELIKRVRTVLCSRDDVASIDETSGIRVNFIDDSWVLVRPSGTEPKVRCIVEGTTRARFDELRELIARLVN